MVVVRQGDGATSLRDLGGKPLAPGVLSWWDVGQALGPSPSSITARKYLVFAKWCDRVATCLSSWSLRPEPLAISGPQTLPLHREVSHGRPEAGSTTSRASILPVQGTAQGNSWSKILIFWVTWEVVPPPWISVRRVRLHLAPQWHYIEPKI